MVTISNAINNTVGASNTGVTNTFTITNPSDTASSSAQQLITVGGTSAGDPWTQWSVGTTQSYSIGIDNSDSDFLKMTSAASGTIDPSSGTTFFTYDPATHSMGLLDAVPAGNGVKIVKDGGGAPVSFSVSNSGVAAGDDVLIDLLANGVGATGDAFMRYVVTNGGGQWHHGFDQADQAFEFKVGVSTIFDQTIVQKITSAGEVTFPLTPAFLATAGTQTDVTGNGTKYTVVFSASERYDQNNDFDGTSTFTAPVSGRYQFSTVVLMAQVTNATDGYIKITTSNRGYSGNVFSATAVKTAGGGAGYSLTVSCDMDAADTCIIEILLSGIGADTADISGTAGTREQSWFCGELIA